MKIDEIRRTDEIKVSAHSWTIKRDGKTAGIIRNITAYTTMLSEQPSKAFGYSRTIRGAVNSNPHISSAGFYEHEGRLYYLYSVKTENFYIALPENRREVLREEYDNAMLRKKAVDEIGSYIDVVRCIVL